jgi:DNA-binding transcriptional ArsR family regulator
VGPDLALRAIAEPHRREILRMVSAREMPVVEIAARFPAVSRPAVSQHLRVLCDAGLLTMRRSGRNCFYRTREDRIERLRSYLDDFWGDRLAALKRAAEREARR